MTRTPLPTNVFQENIPTSTAHVFHAPAHQAVIVRVATTMPNRHLSRSAATMRHLAAMAMEHAKETKEEQLSLTLWKSLLIFRLVTTSLAGATTARFVCCSRCRTTTVGVMRMEPKFHQLRRIVNLLSTGHSPSVEQLRRRDACP